MHSLVLPLLISPLRVTDLCAALNLALDLIKGIPLIKLNVCAIQEGDRRIIAILDSYFCSFPRYGLFRLTCENKPESSSSSSSSSSSVLFSCRRVEFCNMIGGRNQNRRPECLGAVKPKISPLVSVTCSTTSRI